MGDLLIDFDQLSSAVVVVAGGMLGNALALSTCPQRCGIFALLSLRAGCAHLARRNQRKSRKAELPIAQAVGATLEHADLVVEPLDEAERDFVLQPAVGGNAVPMTLKTLLAANKRL